MAITVNGDPHPFREGVSIAELLRERKLTFPLVTVFVNDRRVPRAELGTTLVRDGDRVNVIHLMSGG